MSMTKSEITQVFRLGALNHLNDVEVNENDRFHVFSDSFTTKMKKLIKKQQLLSWRITNTATKKIAVILTSLILVISLTPVKSTGQTMLHFIVQKCEDYYNVIFKGEAQKIITKELSITQIPADYSLSSLQKSDVVVISIYTNNDNCITFTQAITNNQPFIFDSEHGELQTININNIDVSLYLCENEKVAFWIQDNYFLSIVCNGNITQEEVIKIIESIK